MIHTLYDIMDLSRIEALDYFIEGVDISDNVTLLYQRQKPRNKKVKKQIKEYVESYENRGHRPKAKKMAGISRENSVISHNTKQNFRESPINVTK